MTPLVFAIKLLLGVPVALVLALTAIWYIWESGNTVLFDSFAQKMFSGLENYGLLAIPLFMLAGEMMNEGGMTRRLINAARVFVGGFRGGRAYINLLANMFMAAIIGFAAATTAAGGLLAPVIPPSMMFVIYGVLAQVPIGDMFLAGILPGLLLAAAFAGAICTVGLISGFPKGEWFAKAIGGLMRFRLGVVSASLRGSGAAHRLVSSGDIRTVSYRDAGRHEKRIAQGFVSALDHRPDTPLP